MKNVKLETISVSNIHELFSTIEKTLQQDKDTQIFICDVLYNRVLKAKKKHLIWGEAVVDSFHYSDTVEKAFLLNICENNKDHTFQMHFVGNCIGYMQLTFFATKGILYRHYLKGMKRIVIINAD